VSSNWKKKAVKCGAILSIIAAFYAFILESRSRGMDDAFRVAEKELTEHWEESHKGDPKILFSVSGTPTYESLATNYGWIGLLLVMNSLSFILLRKPPIILAVFSMLIWVASSAVAVYLLYKLILTKQLAGELFWSSPRNAFALDTITYDWVLTGIVGSLLVLYIFSIVLLFWPRQENET